MVVPRLHRIHSQSLIAQVPDANITRIQIQISIKVDNGKALRQVRRKGLELGMKDSKNIARIEALRGEFEKLRNMKIRVEADIDRAAADIEKHKAAAREEIGTDVLDDIRGIIRDREEKNADDIGAFEELMAGIRNGVAQLADVHPTQSAQSEARPTNGFRNRAAG